MQLRRFVVRFKRMSPLGMALFPFILIKGKPTKTLINHETIHLRQQVELAVLPFYLWYAVEYLIRRAGSRSHYEAYRRISFEREAFENEKDIHYLKNRKPWQFIRYL